VPVVPSYDPVVHVYNLAGHIHPDLVDLFTAQTGIRVVYEEYESLDRVPFALQREPSRWDVVMVRDYTVSLLRELRLLTPLNLSELPGLKNIDWRFLNLPFDPGSRYSVPYLWGLTVLAYRKDRINPPPEGWDVLWDPSYAGRIMMLDNRREALGLALLHMGYPLDAQDAGPLEKAGQALIEQVEWVRGYGSSPALAAALTNGEIDAAPLFSGDAVMAASRDPNVGYLLPPQGAPRWMDQFVIPRDAPHLNEAYAFINFFCDPAVAEKNASYLKYATPNKTAESDLPAEMKTNPIIYPSPSILAQCRFYPPFDAVVIRAVNSTWTKLEALRKQRSLVEADHGMNKP
jgi:spermidine/putrescine-binding protein